MVNIHEEIVVMTMGDRRPIDVLDLATSIKYQLREKNLLYVRDLGDFRPLELARYLGVEDKVALEILRAGGIISGDLKSSPMSYNALKCISEEKGVLTFVKDLDMLLGGGASIGQVTEFVGTPGVGKTQLAMQLCLDVQIPAVCHGLQGRAVIIDTEGVFCSALDRLAQMGEAIISHLRRTIRASGDSAMDEQRHKATAELSVEGLLRGINCIRTHDKTELIAAVARLDQELERDPSVKLVVLDSVAFPFRVAGAVGSGVSSRERERELHVLAMSLHKLAFERRIAVVVINHLGLKFDKSSNTYLMGTAMGSVWHHAVSNRVLLYQQPSATSALGPAPTALPQSRHVRVAHVIKSARHKTGTAFFQITREGVRGLDKAAAAAEEAAVEGAAAGAVGGATSEVAHVAGGVGWKRPLES